MWPGMNFMAVFFKISILVKCYSKSHETNVDAPCPARLVVTDESVDSTLLKPIIRLITQFQCQTCVKNDDRQCHINPLSRLGLSDFILEAKIDPFECNNICTLFSKQISFEAIRIYFRGGTKNQYKEPKPANSRNSAARILRIRSTFALPFIHCTF